MKDLVSVVIPTYNREKTILRAVNSVLNQTYNNIEVIIVDDCSDDNTEFVVKEDFNNDLRVLFYKLEKNSGACVARNKGVQLSKGKYVAFLDSDDEYLPTKISKQVECLEDGGELLCATDYILFAEDGSKEYVNTQIGSSSVVYKNLLYCNFITTGTLMGRRDCFVNVPFDESLPRYQDWDLVLRLSKKYSFVFLQESTLLQYSQHISITASTSHEKTLKSLITIYNKNYEGYNSDMKAYSQIHWLIGIHKVFVDRRNSYKDLWVGVVRNGFNLRRFLIYIYVKMGLVKLISRYF
jgi:glycosyltransferase involved in cell wall biosynthesis